MTLPATAPRVAERGMCALLRSWVSTCGDMMKGSAAVGDLRSRRSLHRAEATGPKPVAPTSTNSLAKRYDLKLWMGSGDGSAAYLPG
jgi:hypothetical protein